MTIKRIGGDVLARKALEIDRAFAAANVQEATGNNDGDQIDFVESVFGLKHAAYCAMGAVYSYAKAWGYLSGELDGVTDKTKIRAILQRIVENELSPYFDPSPSCGYMVSAARHRALWVPYKQATATQNVRSGDLVFFDWTGNGTPDHVGMWIEATETGAKTVEWNAQKEGVQGVFEMERDAKFLLGTIRVNRPMAVVYDAPEPAKEPATQA